jgi:hypothetical protein
MTTAVPDRVEKLWLALEAEQIPLMDSAATFFNLGLNIGILFRTPKPVNSRFVLYKADIFDHIWL